LFVVLLTVSDSSPEPLMSFQADHLPDPLILLVLGGIPSSNRHQIQSAPRRPDRPYDEMKLRLPDSLPWSYADTLGNRPSSTHTPGDPPHRRNTKSITQMQERGTINTDIVADSIQILHEWRGLGRTFMNSVKKALHRLGPLL
jgi:hypothetical protein